MTHTAFRQPSSSLDRFAAGWAVVCALHCLVLPLAVFSFPSIYLALYSFHHPNRRLAMGLLELIRHEPWFVMGGALFSGIALIHGWRVHRQRRPAVVALLGILLLGVASVSGPWFPWLHTASVVAGGVLLVMAHRANAISRRCADHDI